MQTGKSPQVLKKEDLPKTDQDPNWDPVYSVVDEAIDGLVQAMKDRFRIENESRTVPERLDDIFRAAIVAAVDKVIGETCGQA